MSHVLQTGSSGLKYTHQQLKFTIINIQAYYQGSHREVFPPSMKAAGVDRPQQFVVLIKQLTFSENLTS